MHLNISKALHSDLDALESLYDALNDYLHAHVNYPGWKKGVYPTRKEAMHFFESDTLYVAKIDGKLVGSLALTHEPEASPVRNHWLIDASYDALFVIHVFVIHPDYLRQGIGTKMLQFAEELGRQQNIQSIRLDVYAHNTAAIKAYEKNGYQYIDTVDLGLGCYGLDWFHLYEKIIVPYTFEKATPEHIAPILALVKQRIGWMDQQGIHQWNKTDYLNCYPPAYYEQAVQHGCLHVLKRTCDGCVVGAVVLSDTDKRWPDDGQAFYVHNLVTDCGEKGAGEYILNCCQQVAIRNGKTALRLDCQKANAKLNTYYASKGFVFVAEVQDGPYVGNKREKPLHPER